jgi:hypothetical protein
MFHPTRLNLLGDILAQAGLDTKEGRHRETALEAGLQAVALDGAPAALRA